MFNRNPKYDNDLVNLGYLKTLIKLNEEETKELIKVLPKSYSSPPIPPYYVGSVLYYEHQVYRCNRERLQGTFNWEDWSLVATDNTELSEWIENTYSVDKLLKIQSLSDRTNSLIHHRGVHQLSQIK